MIDKNFAIKVTLQNSINFPLEKERKKICDMIEETNFFRFANNSRIDNAPIYIIKENMDRLAKIQKLQGVEETVYDKIESFMSIIEDDISYITIYQDDIY